MKDTGTVWDVVVVGGGPAGMMAAGTAAERGARVLLIEKNKILGKKLLITGGGRCNVTNAEFDTRALLAKFKGSGKFLFSTFSQRDVQATLDFFHSKNMPTKIEAEKRVFPASNTAQSVWDVLVTYMKEGKVTVMTDAPVIGFITHEQKIIAVKIKGGTEIKGKSFILATGGKSRPETGSTGDGLKWLKDIGHTVHEMNASLVPVAVKDVWVKQLSGISLPEVKITVLQNGVKQLMKKGKILFTHFGVSGPTILNMSGDIGELLKYGEVVISLDVVPTIVSDMLDKKLQELFREQSNNKKFKNALSALVPSTLAGVVIEVSKIDPDTFCHSITREERLRLGQVLKHLTMRAGKLLGLEKAVVTSGGIDLGEVDFKTMRSRKYDNLYVVGDVLNIDRPSGGYSLQLCWTTGYVAGMHSNASQ